MVAVRVMKAPVHQIVDMVAVRHGLVAAVRSVTVCSIVAGGVMLGIAAIRIHVIHRDLVLICSTAFAVFKVAMVEVIDMAFVLDGEVAAARAVHMRLVEGWHCHILSFPSAIEQPMASGHNGENKGIRQRSQRIFLRNEMTRAAFRLFANLDFDRGA
jgi:hypothetical protein